MPLDESRRETNYSDEDPAALNSTEVTNPTNLIGQIIDGRYAIERQLGKGGIGTVYLAHDRKLYDKPVVVKVLLENSLQDAWAVQKFQQEKEALSRVDHPGVVGILDTGELPDQKPYIVMQYVDGISLRNAINAKPAGMDLVRAALIIKQSGAALNAVHQKKIYHRDLKPENIMLQALDRGHEQVKIVDFGVAKLKESVIAPSTVTGARIAGTLVYMSPEQLRGEKVTAASDIYSLAVITYEMVTGRHPFNADTIAHLAEMQRQGVRPKPIDLRPRLPKEAQAIMLKALAYNPKARHQNAAEFGDALASALMNEESTERQPNRERIPRTPLSEPTPLKSESPRGLETTPLTIPLEIAHVLYIDIVGYSRLPMDRQTSVLQDLMRLVRETQEFRKAEAAHQLIRLPTGDGMALVFFGDAESAPRCALELSRALRENPDCRLRMGLHSGPVYRLSDINAQKNVAGSGINMAQRVMDCGDAGHILASDAVAKTLEQLSTWTDKLHDLGEAEVKHGVRVRVYNLYADEVGNPERPKKFRQSAQPPTRSTPRLAISASPRLRRGALMALVALVMVVASLYLFTRPVEAINSIAVLPFVNSGQDPNIEYLSDGITESTINSLSNLPNLKVIARSSVFQYKGKETDPRVAGRDLNVQAVLMGRVVQYMDNLSISVELIDVRDNHRLWGEQYKKKVSDILTVQDEISKEISEKLRIKLTGEDQKRLTKRYTDNFEAYQLYWKGRYYWNKRTDEGLKKGIEYFEQAIDLDPSYALAYAGLADSYNLLVVYDVFSSREAFPLAKAAATKALEIDDTLAEAHTSLAYASMYYDWNWAGAEREYKRAIELNPNYATAHHWYGEYLSLVGRHEEGMAEIRRALELDPLSLIINTYVGWGLVCARRYNEGIEQMRKTLEMDRTFVTGHYFLAWAYEQNRQFPEAIAEYQIATELSNNSTAVMAALGHAYAVSGQTDEAQKVLDKLNKLSKQRYISPFSMALIYAGVGDKDQAFKWLQAAYDERAQLMPLLKVDPRFDNLRSDPRFAELMRRMSFAHS